MPIPIVDEQDTIITYKERTDITQGDRYRVSALWVMNEFGEYLLTQRASTKHHSPNKRTLAVNGTVEQGESYEETIIRESREELGIIVNPTFLVKRKSVDEEGVGFFQTIFYAQFPKDTSFTFEECEVQNIKWVSKSEIDERLQTSPSDFIASFHYYWEVINEKIKDHR